MKYARPYTCRQSGFRATEDHIAAGKGGCRPGQEVGAMALKRDELVAAPPANLATEVYEQLRNAIVEGSIRPNERLIETDLAERLEVSRTPIRESMLRLAGDGLIVA